MNTILIIVNIAVLLLLMSGLFIMQRKHISFTKRVFAALGWWGCCLEYCSICFMVQILQLLQEP